MSSFPVALDEFTEINTEDIAYASIVNGYQTAVVACQTQLESLLAKNSASSLKILALTYKVTAVAMPKWYGNEPERTPRLPDALAPNRAGAFCAYGPYCGEESYITLDIPSDTSKIPNAQSFHPNNVQFVTVEAQSWASVDNVRESVFENEEVGQRKSGGPYIREGLLYHNGNSDLAPKYVVADWTPLLVDDAGAGQLYTIYSFLVHLVIMG